MTGEIEYDPVMPSKKPKPAKRASRAPVCTHDRQHWVTKTFYNDWTGENETEHELERTSTCVDVDLHRYRCTQCGKTMYYSGAAHDYYEKGIKSPGIRGLS